MPTSQSIKFCARLAEKHSSLKVREYPKFTTSSENSNLLAASKANLSKRNDDSKFSNDMLVPNQMSIFRWRLLPFGIRI